MIATTDVRTLRGPKKDNITKVRGTFDEVCAGFIKNGATLFPSRLNTLNMVVVISGINIAEICHPDSKPLMEKITTVITHDSLLLECIAKRLSYSMYYTCCRIEGFTALDYMDWNRKLQEYRDQQRTDLTTIYNNQ